MSSLCIHISVPGGGRLFEMYLEMMGSSESYKQYRSWLRRNNDGVMDVAGYNAILKRERGSFHGFVITACGNISTKLRRQRFYLTFVARYHGLSRKGIELLAHFGLLVKMSTYDAMEKSAMQQQQDLLRYQPSHLLIMSCVQ